MLAINYIKEIIKPHVSNIERPPIGRTGSKKCHISTTLNVTFLLLRIC